MSAVPISIRLNDTTYYALGKLAKARKRTVHWLMTDAIQKYTELELKQEVFRKETLKAWEEYAETGLHLTLDEVSNWAETWGTDKEKAAPTCHE